MSARHTGNRYGRSEEARLAVLYAADDLVVQQGFAAVTMESIARAAGVSKQTIYRWWDSKTAILIDVLVDYAEPALVPSAHGDLRADLLAHAQRIGTFLFEHDEGAVYRALFGQALVDGSSATKLRTEFEEPQQLRDRMPFDWANERGEDVPDDPDEVLDRILGPLYYRALAGRPAPSNPTLSGWVDAALSVRQ